MIAIVIGFVSLFLSNYFLFRIIYFNILIFLGTLILVSYDFLRIKYWTYYSYIALFLSKHHAIKLFNDYNSKFESLYFKEVPVTYTCLLQIAIKCRLWNIVNDVNGDWLSRQVVKIVLKTGG